jgi:hypothetical protein
MKAVLVLCGLAGAALVMPASRTLAQSGVLSGPPQVQPNRESGAGTSQGLSPTARPQAGTWIAVTGGFDGAGRKVAVGYSGFQRSRSEAEDAALQACRVNEATVACRNAFAVSSGCLYIVPGNRSGGGVTWGRGGTRQAAFDECRRGGYTCPDSKIIGGCLPGAN